MNEQRREIENLIDHLVNPNYCAGGRRSEGRRLKDLIDNYATRVAHGGTYTPQGPYPVKHNPDLSLAIDDIFLPD